jgi:hypothetical protein
MTHQKIFKKIPGLPRFASSRRQGYGGHSAMTLEEVSLFFVILSKCFIFCHPQ